MAMLMVGSQWKTMKYSSMISSGSQPLPRKRNAIASSRQFFSPLNCTQQDQVESGIMCQPCSGKGWVLCDFCGGQKTNVKAANKRIYRRCPSCRAIGYVLCQNCKVFKCVTFPNYSDIETPSL
ncbi:chaperone protein dnaJ-related [Euphorbia peplus]|nr:chaperone protein dnaJ-related [Euphorbia peplus]